MDIREIADKYRDGYYTYSTPTIPTKVKDGHVFDENLSVKQNREMVAEHNKRVEELWKEARREQNKLHWQLTEDVINYIMNNYELNEPQARMVERFVYSEKHAFMSDYFAYIDEFAEFAEKLVNNKEETND